MAHWLVKVEPSVYSWEQFKKDGTTTWDGVRNYAARNHLRSMKKGEEVFVYYSMEETAVIGTAKVSKEAFPDPTADDDTWSAVELKVGRKLKHPVSLKRIKAHSGLKDMALVRISRLSVGPVSDKEWDIIMKMSEKEE
ncbi:MAG: EVE domain-containing protein [Chitinophagaceae bacterium]|nr:EVE domain-containing protein [Chitinophagaceae bacterium]